MANKKKADDTPHKCYVCKESKPRGTFPKKRDGRLHGECWDCRSEPGRKYRLRTKFRMTVEQYDEMFQQQFGLCAICHKPDPTNRRLSIDHDHETDAVRALLCNHCNTAIGLFEEDVPRLHSAIEYLNYWHKRASNEEF